jgi:hypothetical protein
MRTSDAAKMGAAAASDDGSGVGGAASRARAACVAYSGALWREHVVLVMRGVAYALRPHTLLTLGVATVAVWMCAPERLDLAWDANFQLVVFSVVFPLTYSISENFRRRERCADVIAQMKASSVAVYWAHRDWDRGVRRAGGAPFRAALPRGGGGAAALTAPACGAAWAEQEAAAAVHDQRAASVRAKEQPPRACARNAYEVLHEFLVSARQYLVCDDADAADAAAYYARAMRALSTLHLLNEVLGDAAGYSKGGEGGISRVSQYTRNLLANLEQLRILRCYSGSPHGMRYFCALMTHVSPWMLAPYWRNFGASAGAGGSSENAALGLGGGGGGGGGFSAGSTDSCAPAYYSCALYCVVLCTLYAVSVDIEDLTDGQGLDDICFNLDIELEHAARAAPFCAVEEAGGGKGSGGDEAVPRVRVSYDDALGEGRSAELVQEETRVFAHRDPSMRLSAARVRQLAAERAKECGGGGGGGEGGGRVSAGGAVGARVSAGGLAFGRISAGCSAAPVTPWGPDNGAMSSDEEAAAVRPPRGSNAFVAVIA